jgi:class 3 adenylate cyclase
MAYVELTIGALVLAMSGPVAIVAALYLDLSRGEYLEWMVWFVAFSELGLRLGLWSLRSEIAPIRAWLRGEPTDPQRVRDAAVRFTHIGPRRCALVSVPTNALIVSAAARIGDFDAAAVTWTVIAYAIAVLIVVQFLGVASRHLMRPIIEELAPLVPVNAAIDAPRQSVETNFGATLIAAAWMSGMAVPVIILGTAATTRHFGIAIVSAGVMAVGLGLTSASSVTRPVVEPIHDLLRATERVHRGDLSEPVIVRFSDELGDLAVAFNVMQQGLRERQALHAAFGSYVDPLLAQRLIESGSSVFEGEETEVSVLFADVRDFTSFSEGVEPAEAVELLNRLFDVVVPALHEHGGHANHYLGDGLLAIFGAPNPMDAHADAAVAAAVDIQGRVRSAFGTTLRLGIGINTGKVIAGTVGGGGRHEFTVIGDTVNVAARVEQLTKDTGDLILITDATRTSLSTPRRRTTKRGAFDLKGKSAKVTVHAVNAFPRSPR